MSSIGRPREHDEQTRVALLAAAERLIAQGGPDALSVRAVAKETETTTRAVYSVFGSMDALVAALAQTAFELLYRGVEDIPEADPVDDLVTIGLEVFRRFVREHPALYRIAFQRVIGLQPQPGLAQAREKAFVQLQARVGRLKDAGLPDGTSVRHATVQLIAMFEGLANAELRGDVLRTIPPGEEEHAWQDGVTTLVHGMTHPAPEQAKPSPAPGT